jgi:hypothetical protein
MNARRSNLTKQVEIYLHAREFERAVGLLGDSPNSRDVTTPRVVNSAFCLELYLKCLLHIERGEYPKEHKLLKLFELLSLHSKRRLDEHYLAFQKEKSKMRQNRRWYSLREILNISNDAFIDWRYSFDHEIGELSYCAGVLIPCVKRVIGQACPIFRDENAVNPSLLMGLQVSR